MTTSSKSKAELEQIALAMMMMAGGEGTSASASASTSEVVGVKTRSSSSRSSSTTLQTRRNSLRQEPVSGNGNCLNKNKTRNDQARARASPGEEQEVEGDDQGDYDPELFESEPIIDESATNLVMLKEEVPDEAIICAVNPLSIQSSPSPGPDSPADSQRSTNSGSGGGSAIGNGTNGNGVDNDCVYMSASRRIFRPEFKKKVLDAFAKDPDCVGNQRATARKFGIHRRQVQKWLQQLSTGELSFKDLEQPSAEQANEESYPESTGLTSNSKLAHSSRSSLGANRIGKVLTRRSVGIANRNTSLTSQQQAARNQRPNGRASDPPTRPTRASTRNRGKSMPLKGGSKSSSHFVPTIVHPSSSSTSKSLLNLSKGAIKQNGGGVSSSSNYAYHTESNGNGGSSSNMFMNMSTLLASAAAAGNLAMPLSLEHPRNFSPRDHSPIHNNGRGSPAHSAGGSSGSGGSLNTSLQNALLLVDELNYLYPYSDFSLLRKALLKEEVSLEKLAHPLLRNKSEFRVNGNGIASDLSQGRRSAVLSPPPKSGSSQQEYNTQQTLDIIRQQQEYLKLLQQCGIGNSSELAGGLNLSDVSSNGKLPAWFNPFAAAAAAGLPVPSTSVGNNGKFAVNGQGNDNGNGRRKEATQDNHRFASPRIPPTVNSGKAKTVAAALAATRVHPTQLQQNVGANRNFTNGRQNQNSKAAQRRKPVSRHPPRNVPQMDDDIDPTSMLEVVTNIPSPSISPRNSSNQYSYNGNNHQHHAHRINGNADYHQGMDLSTTSASSTHNTTTTTTTTRLISKAMNKEYSFLNELGLVRKSPEAEPVKVNNGYGLTHTASLENFVQNIMPSRQKSPQAASSSTSSSSPPATDLNDSEKTKNMVIDAFTYDPEISGDARAVARKFGLSVRVVLKWLKEGPVKTSPLSNDEYHENGVGHSSALDNNNFPLRLNGGDGHDEEDHNGYLQAHNLHKVLLNESNNNSGGAGVNKRKNSKPNQICDFPLKMDMEEDAGYNGALDMVVPIKKRRVSSPNPSPHDA